MNDCHPDVPFNFRLGASAARRADLEAAAGHPFPARPAQVLTPVTVNGVPALFAGPAPGLVGVYQVNFTVPPGSYAVQITIEQGGKQSNLTDLFVSNP